MCGLDTCILHSIDSVYIGTVHSSRLHVLCCCCVSGLVHCSAGSCPPAPVLNRQLPASLSLSLTTLFCLFPESPREGQYVPAWKKTVCSHQQTSHEYTQVTGFGPVVIRVPAEVSYLQVALIQGECPTRPAPLWKHIDIWQSVSPSRCGLKDDTCQLNPLMVWPPHA